MSPNNYELLQKLMSPMYVRQHQQQVQELKEIEERAHTPCKQTKPVVRAMRVAGNNKSEISSISGSAPGTARSIRTAIPSGRLFSKESARQLTSAASARTVKRSNTEQRERETGRTERHIPHISMKKVDQMIRDNLRKQLQKKENEQMRQAVKLHEQIQRLEKQRKRNE